MAADKPAGIDIAIFYDQAAEVAHSVNGFITNFLMALAIVVGVLLVFMGKCSGIIIALSLALNVLGTLLIIYLGDRVTADLPRGADHRPGMLGRDNATLLSKGC